MARDPVKEKAQKAASYLKHREKQLAKQRENGAKVRLAGKKWRATHRDQKRAADRARLAKNPEKYRTYVRDWRASNRGKVNSYQQCREARKRHDPINDFTAAQWEAMKKHYGYKCVYCGKKQKRLTMDHITPISHGGSHTLSNIVPACKSCNSRKGNRAILCPVQPLLLVEEETKG